MDVLLNRVAGARLPGLQAPAVATALCALAYLPVLVLVAAGGRLTPTALGYAVAAGVLASVVPYAADLIALRFVPPRFFSVPMSVHPVLAALVGMVLLGQFLGLHEWIGIAVIVATNAAAVIPSRPHAGTVPARDPAAPCPPAPAAAAPPVTVGAAQLRPPPRRLRPGPPRPGPLRLGPLRLGPLRLGPFRLGLPGRCPPRPGSVRLCPPRRGRVVASPPRAVPT